MQSPGPADERAGASRSDAVYATLRSQIVRGVIRPNQRLIEVAIADRLGVSRTPVREALTRLAADGLIVPATQGWIVHEHSLKEIADIYEARMALEGFAARLAASNASQAELTEIAEILHSITDVSHTPAEQMVSVNDRFHMAIAAASHNLRLVQLIERNHLFYFNYSLAALYTDEEAIGSRHEHEALLDALVARDGDSAEDITRRHIASALAIIRHKLRASHASTG